MKRYLSSLIWTIALVLLYFMDTASTVSFCFFRFVGIDFCPGCGIGHGIHHSLHFRFEEAIDHHLLSVPATAALFWLIIKPIIAKHTSYEPTTINDAGPSA